MSRRRATTIRHLHLTREEMADGIDLADEPYDLTRPRTRGDCVDGDRPCPWVGCKYHLYLDINPGTNTIKLNHPDMQVDELEETCSLDIADRGGATLEEVGQAMNLTRERCRQIEFKCSIKMRTRLKAVGINSAEGFAHGETVLQGAQNEESMADGQMAAAVRRSAIALQERRSEARIKLQAEMEASRLERIEKLGPLVSVPRSTPFRERRAASADEKRNEDKMRASKMDNLEGEALRMVQKALVDRSVTVAALYNQLLSETNAVEEHELTESGIGYYLRTRRAAIDAGELNAPEPAEVPVSKALVPRTPIISLPSQIIEKGYIFLPSGGIWTASPEAALELQRLATNRS